MTYQSHNQKPHSPYKPEKRQSSHTPQYDSHINRIPIRLGTLRINRNPLQTTRTQHQSTKRQIRKDPHKHDCAPKALVIILLLLRRGNSLDFFGSFDGNHAHFGIVLVVEVTFVLRDVDVDFAARFEGCGGEFFGFVVTLCAPGDVVGVAEGVDVEDVDVGWSEKEVLNELVVGREWLGNAGTSMRGIGGRL